MQKYFMTVVNRLRSYLRVEMYVELLKRIFEKDIGGFKDHDYKELFMEFWLHMPANCKAYVNTGTSVGFKIFMTFAKKHFGFAFDEKSFALKAKFRAIVFQGEISENVIEKENVEFFIFLVRERVTTKTFISRFLYHRFMNLPLREFGISFSIMQPGELLNLIDGILGIV
ncbi:hypothetical protein AVEN_186559-1 [Araneus ventricosus]|uniref:Uncharacterized protein n=1 Tax=Araneus ventricosus TaxID=182803 RepID=A0A4Y2W6E8_ARAVE|nr:hypothetical protein AVEN_186559-1 [Araneus ventricosus]